jgi:hypothetical protein
LRKEVCDIVRRGTIGRGELTFLLDELHTLALKPAVLRMEPKSAGEIGRMKSWAMSSLAHAGPMALVEDKVLFGFIASRLMAQDASLAEESVVLDDEFATYLARSNTIQKSLTAAMARTTGKARAPDEVQPPQRVPGGFQRVPEVPLQAQFEGLPRGVRDVVAERPPEPQLDGEAT